MIVIVQQAHHAVVGDVAEDQVAPRTEINRAFCPTEAGRDALDCVLVDVTLETLVQGFDVAVRIARVD